jgi:ABC-type methionine transport system permease subunit
MKTKNILPNLFLGVLAIAALTFIYFVGKDFGHFLAGLKTATGIGDVGYNIGYSLGYLLIPIVTLLLLYTAYRFIQKRKNKHA